MRFRLNVSRSALKRVRAATFTMALLAGAAAPLSGGDAVQTSAVQALTFAQLASCPLFLAGQPVTLPAPVGAAKDNAVRVIGYMLPLSNEDGRTREFLLMRNQSACCFGRMPEANEYLLVRADPGIAIRMDVPVAIEGTLRIEPVVESGSYLQFYRLDAARAAAAAN